MICPVVETYGLVLDGCEDVPLVLDLDLRLIRGSFGWLGEVDLGVSPPRLSRFSGSFLYTVDLPSW